MDYNNKKAIKASIIILTLLTAPIAAADSDVMVTPYDGSVFVGGNVSNDNQAVILNQILDAIPNTDVDMENVNVGESKHYIPDEMLTAKVNGGFMRAALFGTDANFDDMTIKVETNDGVVTLTGYATSEQQAANAVAIAQLVAGVKEVDSNITVKE